MLGWVWVRAQFPLQSSFIDLIYTNHHLLQKCQHCGFSTISILFEKKVLSQIYLFLIDSQFFVDAPLKSNSPYFLLNKNINVIKNKTESKVENPTQTYVKNLSSSHIRPRLAESSVIVQHMHR